jgi:hypothetical protein
MNATSTTRWAIAAVSATPLAGCQSTPVSTRPAADTVALRLATIDPVNDNGRPYGPQAFVDNLGTEAG